jgi:hypothetical protein
MPSAAHARYINENLGVAESWQKRNTAMAVFGAWVEFMDATQHEVAEELGLLLPAALHDPSDEVKDSALFALGKVCERAQELVFYEDGQLEAVITCLIDASALVQSWSDCCCQSVFLAFWAHYVLHATCVLRRFVWMG